jgi:hypothetical protein
VKLRYLGFLALVALTAMFVAGWATNARAANCDSCLTVVDSCCARLPHIQDPTFPPPSRGAVETREPNPGGGNYCVTLFDLTANIPAENVNWNPIARYNGPGGNWNATNLGTVFGLTLDKFGNIYVTHTSAYNTDIVGPGGPGAIYRIDASTGAITVFATLPNSPDPNYPSPNQWPGLGNISFDCDHNQFFVTDMEDGRVYRIHSNNALNASPAVIDDYFDPGTPDNGAPGFAPRGERLWAVQWHANRVYYSIWNCDFGNAGNNNVIRSVGLDGSGDFVWWSDRFEVTVPYYPGAGNHAGPVSDMSFGPTGKMLLGERTMSNETYSGAHQSRVLEYLCDSQPGTIGGSWIPANTYGTGVFAQTNAAGGVDYDYAAYDGPMPPATSPNGGVGGSQGRVWATSDAIHFGAPYPDYVYGLQGNRPANSNVQRSLIIDADGIVNDGGADKTQQGDVEIACPVATVGEIHGNKFLDSNHNGIKDGTEPGLSGWTISITGPVSGTTTTNASGDYAFTGLPSGKYIVTEITQPGWVLTAPTGGSYSVNVSGNSATGINFGNYRCQGTPCVTPPSKMVSWWPLDEAVGTTAHDIMGPNPGSWVGGPTVVGGQVAQALLFNSQGTYVAVNNNASLNFGTGPFSIDAWIFLNGTAAGPRVIVDKRTQPGPVPIGYSFLVASMKLGLQIGDGTTVNNLTTTATMTPGAWHHVAATIDRSSNSATLYIDGTPQTFATTVAGSVSNGAQLWIGQRQLGAQQPFEGIIDEVEIFSRAITGTEVASLYNADGHGKCKEACYVPKVSTYTTVSQQVINVCFTICNNNWNTAQTYNWTLAGLPTGPGCTVAGPTSFSPSSGTVVVPAGGCVPVCVNILKPAGLAPGQTACYQLTVLNTKTGDCFNCFGKLTASYKWIYPDPTATGLTIIPANGGSVSFTVINNQQISKDYSFQVEGLPSEGDATEKVLSLNGLPPGEPVIGTLSLAPGDTGHVVVNVAYNPYKGIPVQEILLEADTDGDGTLEPVAAIGVLPSASTVVGVAPVPEVGRTDRALGYPNPFDQTTGVGFALNKAQSVTVRVFDVNGRLLKTLQTGDMAAGRHYVQWDGSDSHGNKTGAGIYFIRVFSSGRTLESKVVRVN